MTNLIKILRDSVKFNSNFSQTVQKVPTISTATFEIIGEVPNIIKNDMNFLISYYRHDGRFTSGHIINIEELAHNYPSNVKIDIKQNFININHSPIPKYSFEYDYMLELICEECGTKHLFKDIEQNSFDKYLSHDLYCPNCDEYDSFGEIDYEKLEDVLIELNLK
jgi:hypothetical protein